MNILQSTDTQVHGIVLQGITMKYCKFKSFENIVKKNFQNLVLI